MRCTFPGDKCLVSEFGGFTVSFTEADAAAFSKTWPCSNVYGRGWFAFNSLGDLIDVGGAPSRHDGPAWVAFAEHCKTYGLDRVIAARYPEFKLRRFELWTYDVWGNARDGYEVNDRRRGGSVSIKCRRTVYNKGTSAEFVSYTPTDRQLASVTGWRRCDWDGDEGMIFATTRGGRPVGELVEITKERS